MALNLIVGAGPLDNLEEVLKADHVVVSDRFGFIGSFDNVVLLLNEGAWTKVRVPDETALRHLNRFVEAARRRLAESRFAQ